MEIIPIVVISMFSLAKKENNIFLTCITRIFKEIIKIIICFACFYNFEAFKQLAKAAFVQNFQSSHIFKIDKLMLSKDPLHC